MSSSLDESDFRSAVLHMLIALPSLLAFELFIACRAVLPCAIEAGSLFASSGLCCIAIVAGSLFDALPVGSRASVSHQTFAVLSLKQAH